MISVTSLFAPDILSLVNRAQDLVSNIQFFNYKFVVHAHSPETIQLFAEYEEPDTYTLVPELQRTRRWNLTPQMTDSEIVQTAFKLCLTSMEHRTREGFKYKDARVFGPHFDVEDLVNMCRTRENAGGRS
jgi:hypothetical protein